MAGKSSWMVVHHPSIRLLMFSIIMQLSGSINFLAGVGVYFLDAETRWAPATVLMFLGWLMILLGRLTLHRYQREKQQFVKFKQHYSETAQSGKTPGEVRLMPLTKQASI
jgi:hypothetical protein